MTPPDLDRLKQQAALKALDYVQDGMVVGLGTGSTANHFIRNLGERVRNGLTIRGVATSLETATLAKQAGIPLIETDEPWNIDVAIDGADQVDPKMNLIKGGGGALLKEKIVAASAKRFIVMVDASKQVPQLGQTFPLPIEVVPFGWGGTAQRIEAITGRAVLRRRNERPFTTESGHLILDLHLDAIANPAELDVRLRGVPGVVDTGLFIGLAQLLLVGTPDGVVVRPAP